MLHDEFKFNLTRIYDRMSVNILQVTECIAMGNYQQANQKLTQMRKRWGDDQRLLAQAIETEDRGQEISSLLASIQNKAKQFDALNDEIKKGLVSSFVVQLQTGIDDILQAIQAKQFALATHKLRELTVQSETYIKESLDVIFRKQDQTLAVKKTACGSQARAEISLFIPQIIDLFNQLDGLSSIIELKQHAEKDLRSRQEVVFYGHLASIAAHIRALQKRNKPSKWADSIAATERICEQLDAAGRRYFQPDSTSTFAIFENECLRIIAEESEDMQCLNQCDKSFVEMIVDGLRAFFTFQWLSADKHSNPSQTPAMQRIQELKRSLQTLRDDAEKEPLDPSSFPRV